MTHAAPDARPLLITLPLRVQTYDIDVARHVNNQVYIRWLEDLRMEMLRRFYPIERLLDEDIVPIIHSTHITYHRSITLTDEPIGVMWCSRMGRATITLEAEIRVGDIPCATATQRAILLKIGTTKPARIPAELARHFEQGHGLFRLQME